MIGKKLGLLVVVLLFFQCLYGQENIKITIISDRDGEEKGMVEKLIEKEIEALLGANHELYFTHRFTSGKVDTIYKYINEVYNSKTTDVLIGSGVVSSRVLSKLDDYTLPTIAAINLDNLFLQKTNLSINKSSVSNFTFIESPFNIERDLKMLAQITNANKLAVLIDPALKGLNYDFENQYQVLQEVECEFIDIQQDPGSTLDLIKDDIDAVYVLSPLENYSTEQLNELFQGFVKKKLVCFSLIDDPMIEYGAYAAFSSRENMMIIPRRIALNVSKIIEGHDLKDLPVQVENFVHQLVINMESVNKTGIYPNLNILDDALLVNVNQVDTERKINLKSAIAEALENNLEYRMEQKQTALSQKELLLAKSDYLPNVEVSSTGLFLDDHTVSTSFGSQGDFNWSAETSFSQLILSEPALANISIQKLLLKSQEEAENASELDVVLDVVTAYFNYRKMQSFLELLNEDIKVKNENLKISIRKEKVGYGGQTDVYRWETELAESKADFNEGETDLKAVQFQLNEVLNRPINEVFSLDKKNDADEKSELFDERFSAFIDNTGSFKYFADFLVAEAFNNLPEMEQVDLAIKAQERLFKSNQRQMFMPSITLGANYKHPIKEVNTAEQLIPNIDMSADDTWYVGVTASFPIFAGSSNRYKKQKTKIELFQLRDQKNDLKNNFELQIRANLENLRTSYRNSRLKKLAAESSKKNASIIQDMYSKGQVNVTTLIDAQNANLGAKIEALNSTYQFLQDLFVLERSVGKYLSLSTEEQRTDFIMRFLQYKLNRAS
ncbi:TolC family protein [Marinifilum caeruleilacunae]|uniref:Outer membrane protein TolC n=1 Tax=Marinifilum caeruleilacunae TaxID=2499076 RepID=A0ABX1X1D0_9BACT|nr:TolC family protein [Marinifilum caeruleilacunae]NOU62124.1 hypothetical protein [Marinifilum caeruleilacunae]